MFHLFFKKENIYFPDKNAWSSASVSAVAFNIAAYNKKSDVGVPITAMITVGIKPRSKNVPLLPPNTSNKHPILPR